MTSATTTIDDIDVTIMVEDLFVEVVVPTVDVSVAVSDVVVSVDTSGTPGPQGVRGSLWWTGSGAPGSIPNALPGDLYLDEDTGNVWALGGAVAAGYGEGPYGSGPYGGT